MFRRHSLYRLTFLLGALSLLALFLFTSLATAQRESEPSDPCQRFASGDVQFYGARSEFLSPNTSTTVVRPGQHLSFTVRYDICTVATVPQLTSQVFLEQDAQALTYTPNSAQFSAPTATNSNLEVTSDAESGQFMTFEAEDINQSTEITITWQMVVDKCAPIGAKSRMTLYSSFFLPVGEPRADGSYKIMEWTELDEATYLPKTITIDVGPHPSTSVTSFQTALEVSDTTPEPGWTETYRLRIDNTGTSPITAGAVLKSEPEEVGPLIAAFPRTLQRQMISRKTGVRTQPETLESWWFDVNPGDTVFVSWTDAIAFDARPGSTFDLVTWVGHDQDGDGRAIDNEVREARETIETTGRSSTISIDHSAANAAGRLTFSPGDVADLTVRLRNPTLHSIDGLEVALRLQRGLKYEPGSTTYIPVGHPVEDSASIPRSIHRTDSWLDGWPISNLKSNVELRIDYQVRLAGSLVHPGDVLEAFVLLYQNGSLIDSAAATITVSGRGNTEITVDSPNAALPDDEVSYVVSIANTGDGPLEETIFAVDMPCGVSFIEGSEDMRVLSPDRIGGGDVDEDFQELNPGRTEEYFPPKVLQDLSDYLDEPIREQPFSFDRPIEAGETVEISFLAKLDKNLQLGTTADVVFHTVSRSSEGYELLSKRNSILVADPDVWIHVTRDDVGKLISQASPFNDPAKAGEWILLEAVALFVSLCVATGIGWLIFANRLPYRQRKAKIQGVVLDLLYRRTKKIGWVFPVAIAVGGFALVQWGSASEYVVWTIVGASFLTIGLGAYTAYKLKLLAPSTPMTFAEWWNRR